MKLMVTGHRPPRLNLSYSRADRQLLVDFARQALAPYADAEVVYAGGAQGFDQAIMEAALGMGLPVFACIPFVGHEKKWPWEARTYYLELLKGCAHVKYFGDFYDNRLFAERDEWMVEAADECLALYSGDSDGDTGGGTALTVRYARRKGKPVVNVWDNWVAFRQHAREMEAQG